MDPVQPAPSQVRANADGGAGRGNPARAGSDVRAFSKLTLAGLDSPKAAGVIVLGAIGALVALRTVFRSALGD